MKIYFSEKDVSNSSTRTEESWVEKKRPREGPRGMNGAYCTL